MDKWPKGSEKLAQENQQHQYSFGKEQFYKKLKSHL